MSGIQDILKSIKPGPVRLTTLIFSGLICLILASNETGLWSLIKKDTFNEATHGFLGIVAFTVIFASVELIFYWLTKLHDQIWASHKRKSYTVERIKELQEEQWELLTDSIEQNHSILFGHPSDENIRVLVGLDLVMEWVPPKEIIDKEGVPSRVPYHYQPYVKDLIANVYEARFMDFFDDEEWEPNEDINGSGDGKMGFKGSQTRRALEEEQRMIYVKLVSVYRNLLQNAAWVAAAISCFSFSPELLSRFSSTSYLGLKIAIMIRESTGLHPLVSGFISVGIAVILILVKTYLIPGFAERIVGIWGGKHSSFLRKRYLSRRKELSNKIKDLDTWPPGAGTDSSSNLFELYQDAESDDRSTPYEIGDVVHITHFPSDHYNDRIGKIKSKFKKPRYYYVVLPNEIEGGEPEVKSFHVVYLTPIQYLDAEN